MKSSGSLSMFCFSSHTLDMSPFFDANQNIIGLHGAYGTASEKLYEMPLGAVMNCTNADDSRKPGYEHNPMSVPRADSSAAIIITWNEVPYPQ